MVEMSEPQDSRRMRFVPASPEEVARRFRLWEEHARFPVTSFRLADPNISPVSRVHIGSSLKESRGAVYEPSPGQRMEIHTLRTAPGEPFLTGLIRMRVDRESPAPKRPAQVPITVDGEPIPTRAWDLTPSGWLVWTGAVHGLFCIALGSGPVPPSLELRLITATRLDEGPSPEEVRRAGMPSARARE